MSLYQPHDAVELTRRNEKRLNRLERRANWGGSVQALSNRGLDNLIINGDFRINQRLYASGAALTPGLVTGYAHDRWRTGEYMNLVSNPSFETNTTGWGNANNTASRVNTWSKDGSWSLQLASPSAADNFAQITIPTLPGVTYSVSAWARLTAPLTGSVSSRPRAIAVFDNTTSAQLGLSPALPNVAGEARLSVTFVATGTVTIIRVNHGHTAGTIWWDAIMTTEHAPLRPYVTQYSRAARTSYTFTQTPNGCTITLNSGGVIQQVVERANMPAGDYTLTWEGTAQARVYRNSNLALLASIASGPLTFTTDGSDDIIVEFEAVGGMATLANVNLVAGIAAYPYRPRHITDEFLLAQRYYWRAEAPAGFYNMTTLGVQYTTSTGGVTVQMPTPLRVAPVVSWGAGITWSDLTAFNVSLAAVRFDRITNDMRMVALVADFGSPSGSVGRPGAIRSGGGAAWLALVSEF